METLFLKGIDDPQL